MLDETLVVVFLNPAAESLIGVSENQAIGTALEELLQPCVELLNVCDRALQSGLAFRIREVATRATSRPLLLDCYVSPLQGGLLLELTDQTLDTRLRLEEELVSQQKISRRIVRQLAHEVKNPLGGMRGAAQLLEKQLDEDRYKAYTRVIVDEVDRLAALVDSTLQAGARPQPTSVNVHEITEHVIQLLAAENPAHVALVRDYDPSLPSIVVDKHQLIQALLNIARNAMQAVGESGTVIVRTRALTQVTIGRKVHRLVVAIDVEDNGPGIPEDLRETIFYPLVSGREGGSGLGLTIAQDLVSGSGGLIEVSSEPGHTVFQIRLPVESMQRAGEGA